MRQRDSPAPDKQTNKKIFDELLGTKAEIKDRFGGLLGWERLDDKRNGALWGFKGIKGRMFFDLVANVADDLDECDQELKATL